MESQNYLFLFDTHVSVYDELHFTEFYINCSVHHNITFK